MFKMKIGGRLKNVLLVTSNLPFFWLQRWACCGSSDAASHDSSQLISKMEGESG